MSGETKIKKKTRHTILKIIIVVIVLILGAGLIYFGLGILGALDTVSMALFYYPNFNPDEEHEGWKIITPTDSDFKKFPELMELFDKMETDTDISDPQRESYMVSRVGVKCGEHLKELENYLYRTHIYWNGKYYSAAIPQV